MSLHFARVEHAFPPVDLLRTDYVPGEVPVASKLQGVLDFVALAAASPYGARVGPAPVVRKVDVARVARRKVDLFTKEGRLLRNSVGGGGLEGEVDALAGADALEVGLLVAGDALVVAEVQLCQRPVIFELNSDYLRIFCAQVQPG